MDPDRPRRRVASLGFSQEGRGSSCFPPPSSKNIHGRVLVVVLNRTAPDASAHRHASIGIIPQRLVLESPAETNSRREIDNGGVTPRGVVTHLVHLISARQWCGAVGGWRWTVQLIRE